LLPDLKSNKIVHILHPLPLKGAAEIIGKVATEKVAITQVTIDGP
jgi:hypothetical protein